MKISLIAVAACLFVSSAQLVDAQEPAHYRDFRLGSDLATVAKAIGTAPSAITLIHQRPAVMQNIEWRPRYFSRDVSPATDPVDSMMFRFYDDQLFAVIVDYDRQRTAGLTDADMIEAVSVEYGPARLPAAATRAQTAPAGADATLATWGDAQWSVTLVRAGYPLAFRLVVTSTRLEQLARAASTEANRLD